ncbi:peptidylprolyl isomerase [Geobacter sp. DSM 9736]|uniref:peptidylprolyl isomerase n=1 Tax=Geobacter sp. DSM 9736 TaxID=1277350 RepID=UPI000B507038|nr:peptidylprolyl isomerase [Geobacter sp. DSM 9736]SNB44924.1 peptidyl-prolyl cis-trans isomerase C [Geobacter sp. DSM 9736]
MNAMLKTVTFAFAAVMASMASPSLTKADEKPPVKLEAAAPKQSPDAVVAKVNGVAITRGEIDRAVKIFLAQNRSPQQPTPEQVEQLEEGALEQMIAAEVLYQAGVKQAPKDVEKLADEKVAQGKARFPSQEEFEKALNANSLTEKELKELTRKDIIINNLVEKEVASRITVPDSEAEKFYKENIDKFKRPESIKASHILVGVDSKASAEDKKKAREKADGLLKKIKEGGDFAVLAKENSTCPSSAQGGDLGYFGKGQMVPPFEKAAFSLKPGEVSDVVETQFGYHIIKLTEKKEAETAKFSDEKDKIKEYLKNQKMQQAVAEYITELKGKAKVERMEAAAK